MRHQQSFSLQPGMRFTVPGQHDAAWHVLPEGMSTNNGAPRPTKRLRTEVDDAHDTIHAADAVSDPRQAPFGLLFSLSPDEVGQAALLQPPAASLRAARCV